MIRKAIIPIIFTAGLCFFFYPLISNWLSTKTHYTVMSAHHETLNQMTEEEKEAERQKAQQYNESIHQDGIPIQDPFADNYNEETRHNKSYFNALQIGETMARLEIPTIDVHLPIYHGTGEAVLSQGVGHMSNSSLPIGGPGTHAALTAHRGLPSSKLFRNLDKVDEGELFFIHTLDEILAYKIDQIEIVLPSETEWLEMDEQKDYVTLITCEPYMINTHRLLVRGERIPFDESMRSDLSDLGKTRLTDHVLRADDRTDSGNSQPIIGYASVVVGLLIAFSLIVSAVIFVVKRRRLKS